MATPPTNLTCERCGAKVPVSYADVRRVLRVRCAEHGGLVLSKPTERRQPASPKPAVVPRVRLERRERATPPEGPGVIVTLREQTRGNLLTIHRPGDSLAALRCVCRTVERLYGEWRVVSISTPETVLSDLRGETADRAPAEVVLLSAVGRVDLLEATA